MWQVETAVGKNLMLTTTSGLGGHKGAPQNSAHSCECPYPGVTLPTAGRHYQTYFVYLLVF